MSQAKERMANALQSSLDQILAGDTPAVPENLERQLRIVLVKHKLSSSFYIDPQIPPTKLFNARQTCKVPVDEKPLALLDMTMFGSAKDAIVFGVRGLYYSRKGKTMQSLYTDLSKLEAEAVMGDIHFFPRGKPRPEAVPDLIILGAKNGKTALATVPNPG
jgi:hypothetical protein